MRWDNLKIDAEEQATLPGYKDGAVIRRFDAPEALDTRFYEVRAKSALNRVPEMSQVPFRWTVNPYRGCSHACTYCLAGDTPVLMADGTTKRMDALRVGDRILGTEVAGRRLRYAETEVLDHWSTIKPAFRTLLADGTELVTSGDHRFLTTDGWKHVGPDESGLRPHLTRASALVGTGRFAATPQDTPDYRRGYLAGLLRRAGEDETLRLGQVEAEAILRARAYLVAARAGAAHAVGGGAIGATRGSDAGELTAWPLDPSDDWRRGFLAGAFDADGSVTRDGLRIAGSDERFVGWAREGLSWLEFDVREELPRPGSDVRSLRVSGGPRELLRFVHLTDPAISRKRAVAGLEVAADARTRVVSVEALGGALRLYDITTGTGDFIADGVVSHNCFARPTHKYLDLDAGRDFEKEIVVKVNVPEVLRAELARPKWAGEHVALGTNTDPYQWVEGRYRLMPGIWEAFRDFANPCSVLTKSPLLLRDLPLMKEVAARTTITANLSVPTLDEKAWRATEPHTPNPRARLEAVGELNRNGIPTGVLIAPLMPGINDHPRQVERILELAAENGAVGVGGIALHLRGDVKRIFMDWLRSYRPDLVPRYERLYRGGAYAPKAERERVQRLVHRNGGATPFRKDTRRVIAAQSRVAREALEAQRARRAPPSVDQPALF